jgi:protein gp37
MEHLEPFMDEAELRKMLTAKTVGGVPVSGSRCFVGDMTDVFGEWVPFELLHQLFAVFGKRPDVTWQVLTKRPDRMAQFFNGIGCPPSVWLGTSVENQAAADDRIPHLLRTPAAVRFLSCEPLVGPVDLRDVANVCQNCDDIAGCDCDSPPLGIDWVIAGGESGPDARPCDPGWFRDLEYQCAMAGIPFHFKQWGEWGPESAATPTQVNNATFHIYPGGERVFRVGKKNAGRLLDGRTHDGFPELNFDSRA